MEKWFVTVKSDNHFSFIMFPISVTYRAGLVTVVLRAVFQRVPAACDLLPGQPPVGFLAGMQVLVLTRRRLEIPGGMGHESGIGLFP